MKAGKRFKAVRIDWIDSHAAPNRWEYLDDLDPLEPGRCTSVGFVTQETPTYLTLAHSINASQACGRITIPTACIIKRTKLK